MQGRESQHPPALRGIIVTQDRGSALTQPEAGITESGAGQKATDLEGAEFRVGVGQEELYLFFF